MHRPTASKRRAVGTAPTCGSLPRRWLCKAPPRHHRRRACNARSAYTRATPGTRRRRERHTGHPSRGIAPTSGTPAATRRGRPLCWAPSKVRRLRTVLRTHGNVASACRPRMLCSLRLASPRIVSRRSRMLRAACNRWICGTVQPIPGGTDRRRACSAPGSRTLLTVGSHRSNRPRSDRLEAGSGPLERKGRHIPAPGRPHNDHPGRSIGHAVCSLQMLRSFGRRRCIRARGRSGRHTGLVLDNLDALGTGLQPILRRPRTRPRDPRRPELRFAGLSSATSSGWWSCRDPRAAIRKRATGRTPKRHRVGAERLGTHPRRLSGVHQGRRRQSAEHRAPRAMLPTSS